jgi:hypothetical protein
MSTVDKHKEIYPSPEHETSISDLQTADGAPLYHAFLAESFVGIGVVPPEAAQAARERLMTIFEANPERVKECAGLEVMRVREILLALEADLDSASD